jgi:hypothetical protein
MPAAPNPFPAPGQGQPKLNQPSAWLQVILTQCRYPFTKCRAIRPTRRSRQLATLADDAGPALDLKWMEEAFMSNRSMVRVDTGSGIFWVIGWMFTIAFAKLIWWQVVLGLLVWPYYLGVAALAAR